MHEIKYLRIHFGAYTISKGYSLLTLESLDIGINETPLYYGPITPKELDLKQQPSI